MKRPARRPNLLWILSPLIIGAAFPSSSFALRTSKGDFFGFFDTTLSMGAQWRVQHRAADLIGIANGGEAYSVNGDDGDLNYDRGLVSAAVKATHDIGLGYRNYSGFVRATYFYDFKNIEYDRLVPESRHRAGKDFRVLDAYVSGRFEPWGRRIDVRAGQQVISWGESTFIQNGINVVNPVDVAKLRLPGSELKEALVPTPSVWSSIQLTNQFSFEGLYLTEHDQVELDVCGTYFATSDNVCEGAVAPIYAGNGLLDESPSTPALVRLPDRTPSNNGQYGFAAHYLFESFNRTEVSAYYLNYHSRVPILGAVNTPGSPVALPKVFFEFPEDIHMLGFGFNTEIGNTGIAWQGEYSHRLNAPLQIDGSEVINSAITALGTLSQLGRAPSGTEVSGYREHDVGQVQSTLTKSFGRRNPFASDDWLMIGEVGLSKAYGLENKNDLRYEAPGTNLPGRSGIPGTPGYETSGFADPSSWGYVVGTQVTYNNAIGQMALIPNVAFSHDVNGTSPGPGGSFVEGRKSVNVGLRGEYRNHWIVETNWTSYFGGGKANLLRDRDFIGANVKFSF